MTTERICATEGCGLPLTTRTKLDTCAKCRDKVNHQEGYRKRGLICRIDGCEKWVSPASKTGLCRSCRLKDWKRRKGLPVNEEVKDPGPKPLWRLGDPMPPEKKAWAEAYLRDIRDRVRLERRRAKYKAVRQDMVDNAAKYAAELAGHKDGPISERQIPPT